MTSPMGIARLGPAERSSGLEGIGGSPAYWLLAVGADPKPAHMRRLSESSSLYDALGGGRSVEPTLGPLTQQDGSAFATWRSGPRALDMRSSCTRSRKRTARPSWVWSSSDRSTQF